MRQQRPRGFAAFDAGAGKGANPQAGRIFKLDAHDALAIGRIDHRIDQPYLALEAFGRAHRGDDSRHAYLQPGEILFGDLRAHFQRIAFGQAEQRAGAGADHLSGFDIA